MSEGYVVTRPYPGSGIGSNLVSLAGAVWLAGRLGRDVVVDWRGTHFLQDKSRNLFTEFLEPVSEIQGVRVLYAPTGVAGEDDAPPEDIVETDPTGAQTLLQRGDAPRFLVLTPFHSYERLERGGDPVEQLDRLRDFFRAIRPRPFVQAEIDRFAAEHRFDDRFVVAVNVATGNGEYRRGSPFFGRVNTDIFRDERTFLRKLRRARERAVRALPTHVRTAAVTFVATDAAFMRELLLRLPNAVTRRSVFPPPGAGRGFADYDVPGYTDRDAIVDMLVDHFLLARCNALIRNPSMFSNYATVVTDFFDGNIRNVETMYLRARVKAARARAGRMLATRLPARA